MQEVKTVMRSSHSILKSQAVKDLQGAFTFLPTQSRDTERPNIIQVSMILFLDDMKMFILKKILLTMQ